MPRRYQIFLHGSGFSAPMEDGSVIRGFYTTRRTTADTPKQAEERAIAELQSEAKFKWLDTTSPKATRCVSAESVEEISWLAWHFSRVPKSFAFYTDEDES